MLKKIVWDDRLKTGFDVIDMQHRELVNKINKLIDVLEKGEDVEGVTLDEIFVFLAEYVDVHFRTEEMYMDQTNYPEAADHKKAHKWFEEKVRELHARYLREGRTEVFLEEVESFLIDWLKDHIMRTDKKLARYLLDELKKRSGGNK